MKGDAIKATRMEYSSVSVISYGLQVDIWGFHS